MGGICSPQSDGWAALHLPAIEKLLRCMPEEGPCDSGDVFGTFTPSVDTGVQHSTAFRAALNTLPLATSSGGFELPTPPWPSFKDRRMLDARAPPPIRSEHIAADASGPWQVPQLDMDQDAPALLPAYMMQDVSAHLGGSEEINNRPVGHKKVPKKINIQEEFAHSDCEITTAMIRSAPPAAHDGAQVRDQKPSVFAKRASAARSSCCGSIMLSIDLFRAFDKVVVGFVKIAQQHLSRTKVKHPDDGGLEQLTGSLEPAIVEAAPQGWEVGKQLLRWASSASECKSNSPADGTASHGFFNRGSQPDLAHILSLILRMMLRQEDELQMNRLDKAFCLFVDPVQGDGCILPALCKISKAWKDQRDLDPSKVTAPLRMVMLEALLTDLQNRLKMLPEKQEGLDMAIKNQWLIRDGNNLLWQFQSHHGRGDSASKVPADGNDQGFHAARPMSEEPKSPQTVFLLQVSLRGDAANNFHCILTELSESAVWRILNIRLRPERLQRSQLVKQLESCLKSLCSDCS
ncbi:hypothetical protein AK812_SmicGene30071 [Symbiodinium microadriaticum]|uniref:Reverse transcriptase domain-containing protein n=1 Tax=Symbiodinium microadriaticum TaxID=2951 RepID=A0A1Q9D096_SYMMI|nr:hypothetical protein AK812_SmicGene30071 [Symbiodinium microadriaticum]